MKLIELVSVSTDVAAAPGRLDKIARLAGLLLRLTPDEIPIAIGFLVGWPRQGKIGVGWASVSAAREHPAAALPSLELRDVDAVFDELAATSGRKSASERARLMAELFSRSTVEEQRFLGALIVGEVRQGALEGVLVEAVAKAANIPAATVRRAAMMAGDLGVVATAALGENREVALAAYQLQLFRPVQPMLAGSASSVVDAMADLSGETVAGEWKIDGARVQVHRQGDRVAGYTRSLNEVTEAVQEVVDAALALPAHEVGLDGEVIALQKDGRPLSFQDTMHRFGRRINVLKLREERPLTPFFFDILYRDGITLLDEPLSTRLDLLDAMVPGSFRTPRIVTNDPEDAVAFQADVLKRGHEGVMVKAVSAPYAAGQIGRASCRGRVEST